MGVTSSTSRQSGIKEKVLEHRRSHRRYVGALGRRRIHKCAFQVNPHHYAGTYRGRASALDEADYARALADKAAELGVTVLAVTDPNHVGGVGAIRAAARERCISVFPDFELTSTDGVHLTLPLPSETT